jgi:hypothetical protein
MAETNERQTRIVDRSDLYEGGPDRGIGSAAEPRRISCGCCTNGCTCFHHQDTPNGRPPRTCELHAEAR